MRRIIEILVKYWYCFRGHNFKQITPPLIQSNPVELNDQFQSIGGGSVKPLKNISEIRRYFHRNETPIYFISATNFNLLGISEWVRNFRYINYLDCFDGRHPMVRIPKEQPHR